MNGLRRVAMAAMLAIGLAACQREAPPTASAPAPVVAPVVAPAPVEPVVAPALPDYAAMCRAVDGAWMESDQLCEVTSMLCPRFGEWVNGSGCKTAAAKDQCRSAGQQFDEKVGCLIRHVPAALMRAADFKKE